MPIATGAIQLIIFARLLAARNGLEPFDPKSPDWIWIEINTAPGRVSAPTLVLTPVVA